MGYFLNESRLNNYLKYRKTAIFIYLLKTNSLNNDWSPSDENSKFDLKKLTFNHNSAISFKQYITVGKGWPL